MKYLHIRIALLIIANIIAYKFQKEAAFFTLFLLFYYIYRLLRHGSDEPTQF